MIAQSRTTHSPQPMQLRPAQVESFRLPRNAKPKGAFNFTHRPEGWRLEEGHGFVPVLGEISTEAGVNGVRRINGDHAIDGPVDISRAIELIKRQGAVHIDPKDGRLGEYVDYDTHYYETGDGRRNYVCPWERCTVLPTGKVVWDLVAGQKGLLEFRLHLRDHGIVPAIDEVIILGMLDKLRTSRDGILSRAGAAADTEYVQAKIRKIDAQIEAIEAEWAKLREAASDIPPEGVTLAPSKGRSPAAKGAINA